MAVDWSTIIGGVAPTIATGLFGPIGGLVASVAGKILLGKESASPKEVQDYVVANQNPETFAKLKEAEGELQTRLKELDIDLERIVAADRANARDREKTLRDWVPGALAVAVTLGFFGLLGLMAFHTMPTANASVLNIMLGALGAGWTTVLAYYFGSSSGSARKSEQLQDVMKARA